MLQVQGLTRRFASLLAVDSVSFSLAEGELLGLLGLNGAGKSTTMRLLAGALAPHGGSVKMNGQNLLDAPSFLRRNIGYLPEKPPLYPEMRVLDYLRFAARIQGGSSERKHLQGCLEQVGLTGMGQRIIGRLSKGYQQRVGLAQALVHEPQLLILDEPTSGLDPAQRLEIRGVLSEQLGRGRSLILSTHLLEEVQATCDRVLILHQGKIVADEAVSEGGWLQTRVRGNDEMAFKALLAFCSHAVRLEEGVYRCPPDVDAGEVARLLSNFELVELRQGGSLQERFLSLTQRGGA